MLPVFILFAIAAGFGIPIQAGVNARLHESLGDPAWAALVSISVSFLCLATYIIVRRLPPPFGAHAAGVPWWGWTGGALGVVFVLAGLVITPKLGTGLAFALFITGQIAASLVLDQWGFLGLPVHQLNAPRLLGVAMLLGGVVLVRAF
jgi:transporter family-2 protein